MSSQLWANKNQVNLYIRLQFYRQFLLSTCTQYCHTGRQHTLNVTCCLICNIICLKLTMANCITGRHADGITTTPGHDTWRSTTSLAVRVISYRDCFAKGLQSITHFSNYQNSRGNTRDYYSRANKCNLIIKHLLIYLQGTETYSETLKQLWPDVVPEDIIKLLSVEMEQSKMLTYVICASQLVTWMKVHHFNVECSITCYNITWL